MMTTSFENCFSKENIEEALHELEGKRDGCGVDGVYLSQLREYWDINGDDILELLKKETYEPGVVREAEIITSKGKRRLIALYNSIDRLLLRCVSQVIQTKCEDGSFYLKNLGIIQGNSLSPFLSNLYLMPLDKEMKENNEKYCRFADDIVVFFKERGDAEKFYPRLLNKLRDEFKLQHNKQKSGIQSGTIISCLTMSLEKNTFLWRRREL